MPERGGGQAPFPQFSKRGKRALLMKLYISLNLSSLGEPNQSPSGFSSIDFDHNFNTKFSTHGEKMEKLTILLHSDQMHLQCLNFLILLLFFSHSKSIFGKSNSFQGVNVINFLEMSNKMMKGRECILLLMLYPTNKLVF